MASSNRALWADGEKRGRLEWISHNPQATVIVQAMAGTANTIPWDPLIVGDPTSLNIIISVQVNYHSPVSPCLASCSHRGSTRPFANALPPLCCSHQPLLCVARWIALGLACPTRACLIPTLMNQPSKKGVGRRGKGWEGFFANLKSSLPLFLLAFL